MKFAVCFLLFCVAFAECAVVTLPSATSPAVQGVSDVPPAVDSGVHPDVEEELVELNLLVERIEYIVNHLDEGHSLLDGEMVPYGFWNKVGNVLKNAAKQAVERGKQAAKEAVAKKVEQILDTKVRDILGRVIRKGV